MTLRSPSEKLESNAIKKFKTGKLLPNWPHLAANPLACSGRKWSGLIWPQLPWLVLAATQMALCGRKFTLVYLPQLISDLPERLLGFDFEILAHH